ncbi:MAG: PadR family transcriptional regulator [Candidatus Heimdallarchaeota archaeon]|nr:PadR family transcriptional regulator [Candidatus Heimdallarchaeota archaeon]MDH5647454.1 PadR family transcriptional regulator [Candidatus Heimdallarchaeota archaeon]
MSYTIDKWKSRWINSILEYFLFIKIAEKPRYGGELIVYARDLISEDIKIPTVYSILNRSVQSNFLEEFNKEEKDINTRGIPRRYYRLTVDGRNYLEEIKKEVSFRLSLLEDLNNYNIDLKVIL